MTTEVLKTCVYLANHTDVQTAVLNLIADGRGIAASETVLGELAAALPGELADLQGLLHDTLAVADTTLTDVLDTLQRDFLDA